MAALAFRVPEKGFLALSVHDAGRVEDARAVIIPFGLEASVTYGGGTSAGPEAIIAASSELEFFDEEFWSEPFREIGVATLNAAPPADELEEALAQIAALTGAVLEAGKFPLTLGGEHSLTAGAIRPFTDKYPDLAILQFDAHSDLRETYAGSRYSHACAMRRALDYAHISLVAVGLRGTGAEEIAFLEANRHRIHTHWAKDKPRWRIEDIVAPLAGRPIYLTFDVDGFDASLMPATGTPQPGGLFWDEAIDIIRAASSVGTIVGADVVELAPIAGMHACDFIAAKLAYKILTLALLKRV
ncbi:MAG: agmatinase [Hyphomicrobiales bacterium]|nr:agmatinase [Hyphomicrobiales bacterium]